MAEKVWKKKEYLLSHGKIKAIGRGRISADNHAFLEKAVSEGVKFSDYGPAHTVTEKTKVAGRIVTKTKVVREVTDTFPAYRFSDEYRFPATEYKVVSAETGKAVKGLTLKEVCDNCNYSLTDHICNEPAVLGKKVDIVHL